MKNTTIYKLILVCLSFYFLSEHVRAQETVFSRFLPKSDPASVAYIEANLNKNQAYLAYEITYIKLDREASLRKFFAKYKSPLVDHVDTFIKVADYYGIDYRLMPAISCMESTCARFYIRDTHNPFGWGGGYIKFKTFDEAIEGVAKGLDKIYLSRGLDTPEKIAPVYTPPNHKNWLKGVRFFMDQISKAETKETIERKS